MKCPECGGEGECEYEVEVPAPMAWNGGWLEGRIKRMTFPEPTGGGIVQVAYPFVFASK